MVLKSFPRVEILKKAFILLRRCNIKDLKNKLLSKIYLYSPTAHHHIIWGFKLMIALMEVGK